MSEQWTIKSVKEELPMVRLRVGKRNIVDARVSGRLNQFASVTVTNDNPRRDADLFHSWEFAWETIAHSLNTGRPLEL